VFFSDFWVPLSLSDALAEAGLGSERFHDRGAQWLMAAGRLRDGVSEKEAASEIEVIGQRLRAAYPAINKDSGYHIERAGQANPGFRKMIAVFFLLLLFVAALVLATACANVANLLLARASARQQEIATRLAIGAARGRLIRQLLTESTLLSLLGGVGGYAIAQLGASAIGQSKIPLPLPVDFSVPLDYRVMLFSIALSVLTGMVFGLVPALRATRPDLGGALKDEQVPVGRSRRFGLRNLLMLAFDPSLNRYSPDDTRRLLDAMAESTSAIPGVESVSLSSSVPLAMEGTQNGFVPEDQALDKQRNGMSADIYSITPRYFETFGIRMLAGEDFRPGVPAEDIAIVNRALADKAFPKRNPVGRRIIYFSKPVRIVGLVATTKSRSIGEAPHSILYFPIAKNPKGNDSLTGITLALRTRGDPGRYAPSVRQAIRGIDPALALFDVRTMDAQLSQALFLPRASAFMFGFAGFMGLLISTVGIYGVISFGVARQTKEIGIRMALGARRAEILGMVLNRGLMLTVIGAATGLCLALALSRMAASLLYGVSPTDTLTFIAVPAFLLLVALGACLVPARRAASLDPNRALRYE
jgi:ABC-type antimicrobial peptide transport system permease subunit